jgi:hypothetical protein
MSPALHIDIPFRNCSQCEYIEDCPEPLVELDGSPKPPRDCLKKDEIKLVQRTEHLKQKE